MIATSSPSKTVYSLIGPTLYRSAEVFFPLVKSIANAPIWPLYPDPSVYIIVPLLVSFLSNAMASSFDIAIEVVKEGVRPGEGGWD